MTRPPLDPRFAQALARLSTCPPDSVATLKRHATMFAEGYGRTFAEAEAEVTGAKAPGSRQEPVCAPAPPLPQPTTPETPPTARFQAFGAISQRVVDRLRLDPTIGTRQLAREIGCAANLVVRNRRRLGLAPLKAVHTRGDHP